MTERYLLAVVLPCWNCAEYISELLDSLLAQTFSDWKAFFVDDGCTDGTDAIIRKYASKDARIIYSKRAREPKGAPTCRNIGFDLSEGARYVVFMDADDLVAPYCFEQRVSAMERNEGFDFLSFPGKAFIKDPFDGLRWGFGVRGAQETLLSLLNWRTLQITVCTNIYKKSSIIGKGLTWDENLLCMQDADYNIQALTKGMTHSFVEKAPIDYYYRQVNNSVSKQIYEDQKTESHLYFIDKTVSSIRNRYGARYDYYLKSYIVVFFDFFQKKRRPYFRLLKMPFIMKNPSFFVRILLYAILGAKGKKFLFWPYYQYNIFSVKEWHSIVTNKIGAMVTQKSSFQSFCTKR